MIIELGSNMNTSQFSYPSLTTFNLYGWVARSFSPDAEGTSYFDQAVALEYSAAL